MNKESFLVSLDSLEYLSISFNMNSSRRSFSCMCLITTLLIVTGSSNGQQVSTSSLYPSYSSYSSPSAVSQSDGSGSVKNNVPDVGLNSVGGSSSGGIVGNGGEEGQRSATNSGYIPQGSHSMYYYEMYPSPAKQKCTYGKGGMKCQYRRDSGAGNYYWRNMNYVYLRVSGLILLDLWWKRT